MKKILLTSMAATALLFTVESATAQVYEEGATQQTHVYKQNDEMQKIEVSELPQEVRQSVERDFTGATISEAFVKEKDGERKYKVVLNTQEGETRELYADAQGNWIDKEDKDQE